jgi:FtsZ-binding cell division protein ZapB
LRERLGTDLAKKQKETDQLTIEGTEEMEILARLTERVDKAVELIQKLRKENDSLRGRVEEKEKDLADAEAARKKAEDGAASMRSRIEELEGEGGERVEEAEREIEKLREERQAIRKRVESTLERLESLDA